MRLPRSNLVVKAITLVTIIIFGTFQETDNSNLCEELPFFAPVLQFKYFYGVRGSRVRAQTAPGGRRMFAGRSAAIAPSESLYN